MCRSAGPGRTTFRTVVHQVRSGSGRAIIVYGHRDPSVPGLASDGPTRVSLAVPCAASYRPAGTAITAPGRAGVKSSQDRERSSARLATPPGNRRWAGGFSRCKLRPAIICHPLPTPDCRGRRERRAVETGAVSLPQTSRQPDLVVGLLAWPGPATELTQSPVPENADRLTVQLPGARWKVGFVSDWLAEPPTDLSELIWAGAGCLSGGAGT